MSAENRKSSGFFLCSETLVRLARDHGDAGFLLLELLIYKYRHEKYGTLWPFDYEMAAALGINAQQFSKQLKKLLATGVVAVDRTVDDKGSKRSVYRFNLPKETTDAGGADDVAPEKTEKTAPVESNPNAESNPNWDKFVAACPAELAPLTAEREFKKLKPEHQAAAAKAVVEYGRIYKSALPAKQRYFPSLRNWLSNREFLHELSYWRQRAGTTLRASGGVPEGVSYAAILRPKIQVI